MTAPAENPVRRFCFERDSFAFHHELVWKYHFDPVTGAMTTYKTEPPPTYYHRCFVLVRATRLFFDYAKFAPELPAVDFADPGQVVKAIGPYSVKTTYYDRQFQPVTKAQRPGRYGAVMEVTAADGRTCRRFLTLFRQGGEPATPKATSRPDRPMASG